MVRLEGGKRYKPKDADEVKCEVHGFITTWGKLSGLQQLAVEEGLDTTPDLACILSDK